jgi:hypothetical protein
MASALHRSIISGLFLIIIVLISPFLPVGTAQAQVQTASIQWLLNEPNYKVARIHVLTHNASYTLRAEANISVVGPETYMNITIGFNPEGYPIHAFAAVPDQILDTPWNYGNPVDMIHITIGPTLALIISVAALLALIIGLLYFVYQLFSVIDIGIKALFEEHEFFWWFSIPFIWFTLYQDKTPTTNNLELFIPDPRDPSFVSMIAYAGEYNFCIATEYRWWLVQKHTWQFLFWTFTWYSADWVDDRGPVLILDTPPIASFDWLPKVPTVGQSVALTSTSFDPDPEGDIINFHWAFGDGTVENGNAVEHIYLTQGDKHVVLEVTDSGGDTNSTSASILIANRALDITADSPVNILVQGPDGSITGYDSATGDILLNIAGSFYSGPDIEPQNIQIPDPSCGIYTVRVVGTQTGEYTLTAQIVGPGGAVIDVQTWSHTTQLGEIHAAIFRVNSDGTISEPSFCVIPEVPFGTIMASAAMMIALVAYVAGPRWRRKRENLNP